MAPKTSTFFDLKTCLRSKAPHSTNAIGAPPSIHKGKGKGKLSDRPPLFIPGKNKGQGKFTPKGSEKGSEKGSAKAPRKDPLKVLEKEQERAKAKAKEKERATNNSCTIHFPYCNGITPSRMAAAPPYRCTHLPSLQRYIPTHAYYTLATGGSTI